MPASIREQVVAAIQTRLNTDLAPAVISRGESVSSLLPAITIWDTQETAEYRNSTVICSNTLGIEYVAEKANDQTANELLAALIQTMGATRYVVGGVTIPCRYSGASVVYPESGSKSVGVRATFEITYSFKSGDPFTQP